MVRSRARITESEDPASARAKLAGYRGRARHRSRGAAWVEPRLAHLLGLAEAPPGGREELFSAWRTFFERIADRAPTVLVFEDLQWADPGLVDFVESILEWSRSHADLGAHPGPSRARRPPADLGRRPAQLHLRCTSSR